MGVMDFSVVDTTPGRDSIFSPPENFSGDEDAFVAFIKSKYKDVAFGQYLVFQAQLYKKRPSLVKFKGPYESGIKRILKKVA